MGDVAGLNNATTADVIMGFLYGLTAVVLLVTAYIIYTKQYRRQRMEAVDTINFITAKYNIYKEKTQLLIEVPSTLSVKIDLLDHEEKLIENLLDKELDKGEHIVVFDPKLYQGGQYYFRLISPATSILKKIKITD